MPKRKYKQTLIKTLLGGAVAFGITALFQGSILVFASIFFGLYLIGWSGKVWLRGARREMERNLLDAKIFAEDNQRLENAFAQEERLQNMMGRIDREERLNAALRHINGLD